MTFEHSQSMLWQRSPQRQSSMQHAHGLAESGPLAREPASAHAAAKAALTLGSAQYCARPRACQRCCPAG